MAKGAMPDEAVLVDEDEGGRPTQTIARHGQGNALRVVRGVDANWENDSVLVQKDLQRGWRHGCVMLEHGVKSDHRHVVREECLLDTLELRQAVGDAARTKHLKRPEHDHPAAQAFQGQRVAVEPLRRGPRRGGLQVHGYWPFQ